MLSYQLFFVDEERCLVGGFHMNKREILSFVSYANTWPQRFVQRRFFLAVFVERLRTNVKLYELADA